MKKHHTLRTVALAGVCLAPLAAAAQDDDAPTAEPIYTNQAEVGASYVSNANAAFGRYNGMVKSGTYLWGDLDLSGRGDAKTGSTRYFEVTGTDLAVNLRQTGQSGFGTVAAAPNASVNFKVGDQGTWGVTAGYDAITFNQADNFSSPYDRHGNLTATGLAAPINAATPSSAFTNGVGSYSLGTRRDIFSAAGKYEIGDWLFSTSLKHEHKDGLLLGTGQFSKVTTYLQPVDYDTDIYRALAQYATRRFQVQVSYAYSQFTDNDQYMTFANIGATSGTTVQTFAPSNAAHIVQGTLGYNITPETRIAANMQYQLQMQNEPYAPSTVYGATGALNTLGGAPFATSLGGYINKYFGNVSLNSQPIARLDLSADYTLDVRDDHNQWQPDNTIDHNPIGPESWVNQDVTLEAGYKVLPSTKVSLNYTFKNENVTHRAPPDIAPWSSGDNEYNWNGTFAQHTTDNVVGARVNSRFDNGISGLLSYEHDNKDVSYNNNLFTSGDSFVSTAGTGWFYMESPSDTDTGKVRLSAQPIREVDLGLNGKVEAIRYHNPGTLGYGLQNNNSISVGPDLRWTLTKDIDTHLFYTFERYYNNESAQASSAATPAVQRQDTEDVHTLGVGGKYQATDKLKFGLDYVFTYGNLHDYASGKYGDATYAALTVNCGTGSSTPSCGYPDSSSTMQSLKAKSEYEVSPGITLAAMYNLDLLDTKDAAFGRAWYYNNIFNKNTLATELVDQSAAPHYAVNTISVAVKVKW